MKSALPVLMALVLGACASNEIAQQRTATQDFARSQFVATLHNLDDETRQREARAEVARLLDKPLSMDDAVRLTLAWSPALQSMLAELEVRSAQATQSARLPNPVFAFERMLRVEDGVREVELTRAISLSLLDLVWWPQRRGVAVEVQRGVQLRRASEVLAAVSETRAAWVNAVAASEALAQHRRAMQAAEAAAELARRMQAAGNFSRLQRVRQQAFYAEASAALAQAEQHSRSTREVLIRRLGLDDAQALRLQLPERLPDLPTQPRDEATVSSVAMRDRLDLRLAQAELVTVARRQSFTQIASVIDEAHLSLISSRESGKPAQRGFEIEFPLPVFDSGDARRAEAQAAYLIAWHRAQQVARDAGSQLRQSYGSYRTAHALAQHHRDEIVPLAKTVSDEMLLKYNGMLIGVFDLLADARNQSNTVIAAIGAARDFWLADAALQANLLGQPIQAAASGAAAATQQGEAH